MLPAQELITFPDIPGRDSSENYQCRVRQVGSTVWKDTSVLQTKNKVPGDDNGYTKILDGWTESWISFEYTGTLVEVEISITGGVPIKHALVRPVGHASNAEIRDGEAYVTFDKIFTEKINPYENSYTNFLFYTNGILSNNKTRRSSRFRNKRNHP